MIAHASQDENKKYSGGIAGDQGNEVAIRSWYNRPWGHVIRCNDSKMRNKIADAMEAAAKKIYQGNIVISPNENGELVFKNILQGDYKIIELENKLIELSQM